MGVAVVEYIYNPVSSYIGNAAGVGLADTTLTLTNASLFPTAPNYRVLVDLEIMLVMGIAGNVLTVVRAQEGTAAACHSTGAFVQVAATAGALYNTLGGSFVGSGWFLVLPADASIPGGVNTLLGCSTVKNSFGPGGASSGGFEPGVAGVYRITGTVGVLATLTSYLEVILYVNGSQVWFGATSGGAGGQQCAVVEAQLALNPTDLVQLYASCNQAGLSASHLLTSLIGARVD